ncbi:helix-turn-helix transcriptional regulator [Micromonospora sp. STR1s_5]|nr:helix-turn-helix transcriptional regulator [Micromonospora sp. STR1s_5]
MTTPRSSAYRRSCTPTPQEGTPVDRIGLRVAYWRELNGLTQQLVADRVGRSRKWLSQIENGHATLDHRRDLHALATVLRVSVTDLTGQAVARPRSPEELAVHAMVPALRGALDDEPETAGPINVDVLRADVDRALAARMGCDYPALAALLPAVVTDARLLTGKDKPAGLELFTRAAVCAALAIKPWGQVDLASRLVERADAAARTLDRRDLLAAVGFAAAQNALASGTSGGRRRSYALAVTAAEELGDSGTDDALTWYGALHLHAAMSAASLGHHDDIAVHLAEATTAATRIGSDPWRMEVTPANVGVWRVNIALEAGEPDRAAELANQVPRHELRTTQRLAHLHIGAGRGSYQSGNPAAAARHFLEADRVAPAELRSRPTVREIVGQMVRDGQGGENTRTLATRMHVDPLDPDAAPLAA